MTALLSAPVALAPILRAIVGRRAFDRPPVAAATLALPAVAALMLFT